MKLLPCPFCSNEPELSTRGSFIDIDCCVSMSLQKSDVLTMEERDTLSTDQIHFSDEAEAKALKYIADLWNHRPEKT